MDCADADCAGDAACLEDCGNGEDDDLDGDVDCADADCAGDAACPEDCGNGLDDDGDGLVDCEDGACIGDPTCPELCDDGLDDDGDGLVDCEDGDCVGDPACEEDCGNGLDDDLDGDVDCDDVDCCGDAACGIGAICTGSFRVQVLDGGMWYAHWYTSSLGAGCSVRLNANSGVLTDLTGGTTCAFGSAYVAWRSQSSSAYTAECGWGAYLYASSSGWGRGMHLSSGCPIGVKVRELAPRKVAMTSVRLTRKVGDTGTAEFGSFYMDSGLWLTVPGEISRVGARSIGVLSTYRGVNLSFTAPVTWTVEADRK